MKQLIAAALLSLCMQGSYAFGLFPRHHHDSGSGAAPYRRDVISPVPEPESYLMLIVGLGAVAWVIYKKKK